MTLARMIVGPLMRLFFERSGRNKSYAELRQQLAASQETVAQRLQAASDSPGNRKQARHISGIERWGQRRLRIALGEPAIADEYDGYQPEEDLSWRGLQTAFGQARAETLALTEQLEGAGVPLGKKLPHNDARELSVAAWLAYLNGHALRESSLIK